MFPGGVYRRVGGSRGPPRVTFGYFSSQKSNPSPGRRTVCHPAVTLRRRRRDKIITFCQQPLSQPAADSLSLRLGHGAALICHWHIIHYRAATSLPLAQGSLWVCRQARRNLFSPITKKKQPFGCFFLVGPAGFGPAGCGSQSPVPYRLATAQSISQGIPEKGIPCAWGG